MKKIKLLCWLLVLSLCLAACSTQPADPTTVSTVPTTLVTTEATTETTTAPTEPARESMVTSTGQIKNIILIIGDGMGMEHLKAGQLYDGKTYGFTQWQSVSINTAPITYAGKISTEATDSAASATAMATGHLTVNKYVGMLPDGTELTTIMDIAGTMGKATGIVTTDTLLGATPTGFSAHTRSRAADSVLMTTQLDSGVNLLCGNTDSECTAMAQQIQEKGYAYCEDYTQLGGTFDADKVYWQVPMVGDNAQTDLSVVSVDALNYLDQDSDGFVLMIEQAHPDKHSHNKEILGTCQAVSNLNATVEAVLNWLGDRTDTAILITADHECGGLVVSNEAGTYANPLEGPNGTLYYEYRNGGHTPANVALYVYGFAADFTKSELYQEDVLKNSGIFFLMWDLLNTK
jgi:alkaline phosphatase